MNRLKIHQQTTRKALRYLLMPFFIAGALLAQPSTSTELALRVLNEDGEVLTKGEFIKQFQIAGTNGYRIDSIYLDDFIYAEENHEYLMFWLTEIYPPFSLRLYHQGDSMILHLPKEKHFELLAVNLRFQPGEYLLDFDLSKLETLKMFGNREFHHVEEPDWEEIRWNREH